MLCRKRQSEGAKSLADFSGVLLWWSRSRREKSTGVISPRQSSICSWVISQTKSFMTWAYLCAKSATQLAAALSHTNVCPYFLFNNSVELTWPTETGCYCTIWQNNLQYPPDCLFLMWETLLILFHDSLLLCIWRLYESSQPCSCRWTHFDFLEF